MSQNLVKVNIPALETLITQIFLAQGVLQPSAGDPTQSAEEALDGTLTALGGEVFGYKGDALGRLVQYLCSLVVGANHDSVMPSFLKAGQGASGSGQFMQIYDPTVFNEGYFNDAERLMQAVEAVRHEEPGIRLAGEHSRALRAERIQAGTLEIPEGMYQQLLTLQSGS